MEKSAKPTFARTRPKRYNYEEVIQALYSGAILVQRNLDCGGHGEAFLMKRNGDPRVPRVVVIGKVPLRTLGELFVGDIIKLKGDAIKVKLPRGRKTYNTYSCRRWVLRERLQNKYEAFVPQRKTLLQNSDKGIAIKISTSITGTFTMIVDVDKIWGCECKPLKLARRLCRPAPLSIAPHEILSVRYPVSEDGQESASQDENRADRDLYNQKTAFFDYENPANKKIRRVDVFWSAVLTLSTTIFLVFTLAALTPLIQLSPRILLVYMLVFMSLSFFAKLQNISRGERRQQLFGHAVQK